MHSPEWHLEKLLEAVYPLANARFETHRLWTQIRSNRGDVPAAKERLKHVQAEAQHAFTDLAFGDLVETAYQHRLSLAPLWRSYLEALRFSYHHQSRLSVDFIHRRTDLTEQSYRSWAVAREKNDPQTHLSDLAMVVENQREEAALYGADLQDALSVYQCLFQVYGLEFPIERLYEMIKVVTRELPALIHQYENSSPPLHVTGIPVDVQLRTGQHMLRALYVDLPDDRFIPMDHPFAFLTGPGDFSLGYRAVADGSLDTLYGILHEGGHGRFWLATDPQLQRAIISGLLIPRMIDESQAMLFELGVGSDRNALRYLVSVVKREDPTCSIDPNDLFQARNQVRLTSIRKKADPASFMLLAAHMVRVEIALYGAQITVEDLSAFYSDTLHEMVGIRPSCDAEGFLQSPHLACGVAAYYGNYLLAQLVQSQLLRFYQKQNPTWERDFETGQFSTLIEWLESMVHRNGYVETVDELLVKATGEPLNPQHFVDLTRDRLSQAVQLTLK